METPQIHFLYIYTCVCVCMCMCVSRILNMARVILVQTETKKLEVSINQKKREKNYQIKKNHYIHCSLNFSNVILSINLNLLNNCLSNNT